MVHSKYDRARDMLNRQMMGSRPTFAREIRTDALKKAHYDNAILSIMALLPDVEPEDQRQVMMRNVQHVREGIASDSALADVLEYLVKRAG